jgi:hypothetical protein
VPATTRVRWCFAIGPELLEAKRRTAERFDWKV